MPDREATAALPKALAKVHKPVHVRPVDRRAEDETADRIARTTPAPALGRDYSVQLASEPEKVAALAAWKRKKAANADLLGASRRR